MYADDETAEDGNGAAAGERAAVHGYAGTKGTPAVEDRYSGGLRISMTWRKTYTVTKSWPPKLQSSGPVQAGHDPAFIRNPVATADKA